MRFTLDEIDQLLNRVMGLEIQDDDVATLTSRTEGWIAGLQMAAVSLQGRRDASGFIKSFTGSNRYILDYLVEEGVIDEEDRELFWYAETAEDIWNGILSWHEENGTPLKTPC